MNGIHQYSKNPLPPPFASDVFNISFSMPLQTNDWHPAPRMTGMIHPNDWHHICHAVILPRRHHNCHLFFLFYLTETDSTFYTFEVYAFSIYNGSRQEVRRMKNPKKTIALNEAEWRLVLHALNRLRNDLIAEGRYTDTVDEVILKIVRAPVKKIKIA
jgi:hypothetical protein